MLSHFVSHASTLPLLSNLVLGLFLSTPSLAYAAKPTSLDIPYPLFKSCYEFVQNIPQPEVETLTGSEKEKWEYATKYPFVALLEQAIPDQHFSFSSEKDVRKEINESLRKVCSNVVQKYKSNRGMARMKLNLCNKKFHIFKGQTEPVRTIRDELQDWKDKCKDLEATCCDLLREIQGVIQESEKKDKIIEELKCSNQELASYIEHLEKAQGIQYQGKPLCEAKNRSRTVREFLSRANVALWYAKAFGIQLKSLEVIENETGQEHHLDIIGPSSSTQTTSTEGTATQYERLSDDEKKKVQEVLFLLDKFCVGDNFYHEPSMFSNGLPKSYLIKQCRDNYNNLSHNCE